jgi:hypothetical protein
LLTIQKKQAKYFEFRREKAPVESGLNSLIRIQTIIVQQKISLLSTSVSFKNNKKSTMTFKEVPVAKS